jgi:hypothetical protein
MISFGRVWETKLRQLWKDSSLSLSEVGRRLGVDPLTVRRHAARLKLPFSRGGRKSKPLKQAARLKGKSLSAEWEKKRHRCRSKWLSTMKVNRKIMLKALRHQLPREYAWLLQNDSEWLEGHKPRPKKRNLPTSSVDWKRRDTEYAVAVREAATRLKESPGRPVQVTKTAIGRALGAITFFQQKLYKLPLSAQVLDTLVETHEQYAIRRIWRAADICTQEDMLPRRWQLILRANVYRLRENPQVEVAENQHRWTGGQSRMKCWTCGHKVETLSFKCPACKNLTEMKKLTEIVSAKAADEAVRHGDLERELQHWPFFRLIRSTVSGQGRARPAMSRPTLSACISVNQMLPSGPWMMRCITVSQVGTG